MRLSKLVKATEIDGCAATQDRDNQDEILSLEGADISEMVPRGYLNDNHGTGFANTLGKITYAKKIFKKDDVEDARQKTYWDKLNRPFLYVRGQLFDEADHANAKAVSAIMHEFKKMGRPLSVQMSVEGKVVNRGENGLLKESKIRNVALTLVPANSNTGAQIVSEETRKAVLAKCQLNGGDVKYADNLMKSLGTGIAVSLPGFIEVVDDPFTKVFDSVKEIQRRVKMFKALMAGNGSAGAPSSRTGGAALMNEKAPGKKLVSTTARGALKTKRQAVLKSLIKKTKASNPGLSYGKLVESVLKVFTNNKK